MVDFSVTHKIQSLSNAPPPPVFWLGRKKGGSFLQVANETRLSQQRGELKVRALLAVTHFHELDHCTVIDKADTRKEKREGEGAADDLVSSWRGNRRGGRERESTLTVAAQEDGKKNGSNLLFPIFTEETKLLHGTVLLTTVLNLFVY